MTPSKRLIHMSGYALRRSIYLICHEEVVRLRVK
jgi:hypothetical protein